MRRINLLVTIGLVALGLISPGSTAAGAIGASAARDRAELRPDAADTAAPRRHRASSDPILESEVAQAMGRPTLSAVNAETFLAWKRSAIRSPATRVTSAGGVRAPSPRMPALGPTFAGLDQAAAMNHGYRFSPADTQVAKGPTFVLEAAGSALRLTTTTGALVDEKDLNTFFGAGHDNANGGLDLLYDPRVYFDRNAANQRMYIAAVQSFGTGGNNGVSRLWLAISRGSDPTSLAGPQWCTYGIDVRRDVGTSRASWADFPQLGVGRDAILISANQFRFSDSSFTFADVRVFDKDEATQNLTSCPSIPFWTFRPSSSLGNRTVFSLQPVQSTTASSSFKGTKNPAYLVNTDIPDGTSAGLHVWRVKNVASGVPLMSWKDVTGTFSYSLPPDAQQPGGSGSLIDTGDTRIRGAAGRGDSISAMWNTGCQFLEGNNETCIVYVRFAVGQTSKGTLRVSIPEQFGWGLGENQHVFTPNLGVNSSEHVGVAAQAVGSDTGDYLGTVWLMKARESVGWPYAVYTPGSCTLGPGENRAGDYTGAQVDPGDNTGFWLAGEYATDPGGGCTWGTTVTRLLP